MRIPGIGRDVAGRIAARLPQEVRDDPQVLIIPCERGQGLAIAGETLAWVGVRADGKRAARTPAWTASIGDLVRVLWNRIDILDRQEVTFRFFDAREVMVAPLDRHAWSSIRPLLEGSPQWPPWPSATVGERLGGFLPADSRVGRASIIFVDSDRISYQGQEYLVDGSLRARFGFRPATGNGGGLLRGYGLADLFTRRSPSGMEPYVHIAGNGWQIDAGITSRDPAYASTLVERINDLGQQFGSAAQGAEA